MRIPMHRFKYTKLTKEQIGTKLKSAEGGPRSASAFTNVLNNWIVARSKDSPSLVGFVAGSSILTFRVSHRTAGSMDSARSLAMTELSAEIAGWEANLAIPSQIDLDPHLDLSTFSGASGLSQRDIRRVTGTEEGWLVELASHPSLAKTALVYLSQDFRVLKVEVRKN